MRQTLIAAFTTASLLIACGGSVTPVPRGDDTHSGGDNEGPGGDDRDDGNQGGGGGDTACSTATFPATRACVPGTAKAGVPITVTVDKVDGCLGCWTTFDACVGSLVDTGGAGGPTIVLSPSTTTCPPSGDQACPAVCGLPRVTCTIPALPAGTYAVTIQGEKPSIGRAPRTLVVSADATETSCSLSEGGVSPPPLDLSKYDDDCKVDDDCTRVSSNLCMPCFCPDDAVAVSAKAQYEADARALTAQCLPGSGDVACAACYDRKAICNAGRCELQPMP